MRPHEIISQYIIKSKVLNSMKAYLGGGGAS